MAKEGRVKLLWDCANALKAEGHTQQLLKSFYMTRCRKTAKGFLQMPKEKFSAAKMCPRCSSMWNDVDFHMNLRPQQIARSAKAKKLIAKLEESKTSPDKRTILSRKQRKRAKWLRKRVLSKVEIECEFCHHKALLPLEKPKQEQDKTETETITPDVPLKAKRKKQKIKDKTAGLKLTKLTPPPPPPPLTKPKKPQKQITEISALTSQQKLKSNTSMQPTKSHSNKKVHTPKGVKSTSANLSQPLKAKKKSKKKSKQSVTTPPVVPKTQSKTQQQNTLLQLAALLKSQTAKPSKGAAQQRLEAMLK